jgi:hypothetical protein
VHQAGNDDWSSSKGNSYVVSYEEEAPFVSLGVATGKLENIRLFAVGNRSERGVGPLLRCAGDGQIAGVTIRRD